MFVHVHRVEEIIPIDSRPAGLSSTVFMISALLSETPLTEWEERIWWDLRDSLDSSKTCIACVDLIRAFEKSSGFLGAGRKHEAHALQIRASPLDRHWLDKQRPALTKDGSA